MPFPFKQVFPSPDERTKGAKNTCQYIIVHHTGTGEGTIKGVLAGLYSRPDFASCHFVVDTNGDAYKIGEPTDILWHAGVSTWGKLSDMNKYSLGIEVVGPLANGGFTQAQYEKTVKLIQHLMSVFKIPAQNVLRHKDVAPSRKWDIADTFWNGRFKTWNDFQQSLKPVQA